MEMNWLKKWLNIYWLRPENAFWRAITCQSLESMAFTEPSLDLSCGDGVFSFLKAGGNFGISFDVFGAVENLDRFFENVDIYNAHNQAYAPEITALPAYQISVGLDWKESLIEKAKRLDFYREFVLHDTNKPLPFENDAFETIFSNSVYWVNQPAHLLAEIARILRPSGQAILVLKTNAIHDYTLERFQSFLGTDWLEMIDRGRTANYPELHSDNGWSTLIEQSGLAIVKKIPQISWLQAHIWDIGLRPLSPVLIEMANLLKHEDRAKIKRKWIEVCDRLFQPFSQPNFHLDHTKPSAENIYLVRKGSK